MSDTELIYLVCENCGCNYHKPLIYKKYYEDTNHNIFYKWSLKFCDKCRRKKELDALKSIPEVVNALLK